MAQSPNSPHNLSLSLFTLLTALTTIATAKMKHPADYHHVVEAHGLTGSFAWAFVFPLGAILIRVLTIRSAIWVHAAVQTFGIVLFSTNFGMGVWMAVKSKQLDLVHPIIGIIMFGLVVIFMPVGGLAHHTLYKKHGKRTWITYAHIWLGRLLITLGIINGGLGMLLSANATRGEYIAYGVLAAVIWLGYIAVAGFGESKRSRDNKVDTREEKTLADSDSGSAGKSK